MQTLKPHSPDLATYLLSKGQPLLDRLPGLVPVMPDDDVVVEAFFASSLRESIVGILGRSIGPDNADQLAGNENIRKTGIKDLRAALRAEYARIIDRDVSLEKMEEKYQQVLAEVISRAVLDHEESMRLGQGPLFTDGVLTALRNGHIRANEEFKVFLEADMPEAGLSLQELSLRDYNLHYAVKSFQARFDGANLRFLDELGLRTPGETDDVFNKRMQDRLAEAVKFLELIYKVVHDHQLEKARGLTAEGRENSFEVCAAPLPKDLKQKRPYDLAEVLFYSGGKFALGKERKFVAQQLLVLMLLYNKIHQLPQFNLAQEVCRRLDNGLNIRLDEEVGREGLPVQDLYVDSSDRRSDKLDDSSYPFAGLKALVLKPLPVYDPATERYYKLFPNKFQVLVNRRVKTPDSMVLKYLNKGDFGKIQDQIAFEFVIDNREMTEEEFKQSVRDLKAYIKKMWNVDSFHEDSTDITGDARCGVSETNGSSASDFKVEKVVFYKTVTDSSGRSVQIPVEVQIKSLRTYLDGESAVGPCSHVGYKRRTTVGEHLLDRLFPREVFSDYRRSLDS